jgi:hypothetical protein
MTIEDDIAFLERVPALAILGPDALRILAIGTENRYVHEGVALFGEGENADGAYVVQEGSFDLVSARERPAPATFGPGCADRRDCAASPKRAPGVGRRARALERGAHSAPALSQDARERSARRGTHARCARGACESDRGEFARMRAGAGGRPGAQVNRPAVAKPRSGVCAPKIPAARVRRGDRSRARQQGLAPCRARDGGLALARRLCAHVFTDYDDLLTQGYDRDSARIS